MITRRCLDRRFYFRPDPQVNHIFKYVLAECMDRFKVQAHGLVLMSNHYHLMETDTQGCFPDFAHRFDGELAKALRKHLGIRGTLFESGSYHMMPLEDPDAVLDKLAYMAMNPASARLVHLPYQWEGLVTLPEQIGTVVDGHITRPKVYFRPRKNESPLSLALTLPPMLKDMGREAVVKAVRQRMHARQLELRGPVLGMKRVYRTRITDRPSTEESPGKPIPHFSATTRQTWQRARERFTSFHRAYRRAFSQFRELGFVDGFPQGTWWMLKYCGALSPPVHI